VPADFGVGSWPLIPVDHASDHGNPFFPSVTGAEPAFPLVQAKVDGRKGLVFPALVPVQSSKDTEDKILNAAEDGIAGAIHLVVAENRPVRDRGHGAGAFSNIEWTSPPSATSSPSWKGGRGRRPFRQPDPNSRASSAHPMAVEGGGTLTLHAVDSFQSSVVQKSRLLQIRLDPSPPMGYASQKLRSKLRPRIAPSATPVSAPMARPSTPSLTS